MRTPMTVVPAGPVRTVIPHELLDAYWFAQTFRDRVLQVVADARCMSTIGRRLETALGRVIRFISEAADDMPERADARLARARAAICLTVTYFDELFLRRGVRIAVIVDLRAHAVRLLERLQTLDGEAPEKWPASNCLPTVLDEVKNDASGDSRLNGVAALEKVPDAALRERPEPVVAEAYTAQQPANDNAMTSTLVGDREADEVPSKTT